MWTGEEPEARGGEGCSGHSILRVGPGSKGWVSWKWWPQKSTVWMTEIRELAGFCGVSGVREASALTQEGRLGKREEHASSER